MENMLIVGGSWGATVNDIKSSGFVAKFAQAVNKYFDGNVTVFNGGPYEMLEKIIGTVEQFDYVFWWANVDNSLPKIRDVKEIAPKVMLINSKRDDNSKYTFQELVMRTLVAKANLSFLFKKDDTGRIEITVYDPLGSVWYQGEDIELSAKATIERLRFLKSMTRQSTFQSPTDKNLVMAWYFDQFKQTEYQSDKKIDIPDEQDFVDVVRRYATEFQKFMPNIKSERFVGNASMRPIPPQVGRCGKGMPSFKKDGIVFVSKRNIDKQFIELNNFVPCFMADDKLMYCGNDKPSVDTPVQIRLYEELPQMRYMLHSHCYIQDAPFTATAIPCGAIEEVATIMKVIKNKKLGDSKWIAINLLGHGALIMWDSMERFHNEIEPALRYYQRVMPEIMF